MKKAAVILLLLVPGGWALMQQHHTKRNAPVVRRNACVMGADYYTPRFLSSQQVRSIKREFDTPVYVYDEKTLRSSASKCLNFPNEYGLTVRFAMKACPNQSILRVFLSMGLHIDASSTNEVERAIRAGFEPSQISLSSQEFPSDAAELIRKGVHINACSLHQLESIGKLVPGAEVGVRFNPGLGSGGTGKTNVGGPSSSFGIWHELAPEVKAIASKYDLKIIKIHTHIGSGSDPAVWQRVSLMSLDIVRNFKDVHTLNLGGGYKVARMNYEKETDLGVVGLPVKKAFETFAKTEGRKLKLEIEPGTFLVANAGALVCTIQDMTTTGQEGHTFLKLDAGMTEILRPSLYAAQHPISIVKSSDSNPDPSGEQGYVVVGHCCESGDLLTPGADSETIAERMLIQTSIGDLCVIDGAGAYCAGMSSKNYNSFPEAPEVMIDTQGRAHLVRRRQTLDQIIQNEIPYSG